MFLKEKNMEKLPPVEKVFEAWTAIVDGRVAVHDGYADVDSSDGKKNYKVRFAGNRYSSDDNATFWRGYPGYPVLAVMMLRGLLPLDMDLAREWRDVNWKEVNTKYKNNYAKAVEAVAQERNIDLAASYAAAQTVLKELKRMEIEIRRKI